MPTNVLNREQLITYAGKKLKALKNDLDSVMMEFSHEDVQDLLSCIGKMCVCVYTCMHILCCMQHTCMHVHVIGML